MAVQQIDASFQNDGNFAQLDLQDTTVSGPHFRIETYRASQPSGGFGVTKAGTRVERLCGRDHLAASSNRVFRNIFSVDRGNNQVVILEIRETVDPAGSTNVRVRDIDANSASYGDTIVCTITPKPGNLYQLNYEVRSSGPPKPKEITSPLSDAISALTGLPDIGGDVNELGIVDTSLPGNPLSATIPWNGPKSQINAAFRDFEKILQTLPKYKTLQANFVLYMRMGDFRDKCIHDGTNLTGPNKQLASEYVLIRPYRCSLIIMGRIADPAMYRQTLGGMSLLAAANPLATDPKPGVYAPFLAAYVSNVEVYQLGLDKVHSDYGGIPMTIAPGSRLETGATPAVDSTRLNRTLAELAFAYYTNPNPAMVTALTAFTNR